MGGSVATMPPVIAGGRQIKHSRCDGGRLGEAEWLHVEDRATARPATSSAPARRVWVKAEAGNHSGQTGKPRRALGARTPERLERPGEQWQRAEGRERRPRKSAHQHADDQRHTEAHHQRFGHLPGAGLAEQHGSVPTPSRCSSQRSLSMCLPISTAVHSRPWVRPAIQIGHGRFPSTVQLISGWLRGRARRTSSLETVFCAELIATTYQHMGLLARTRPASWYDPGRFWSGDWIPLLPPFRLATEIAVR